MPRFKRHVKLPGIGRLYRLVLISALSILILGVGRGGADERMNGMVGLYFSPYNGYSFEYDLILQFQKSRNWIGYLIGPYISEEIGTRSNRLGAGFIVGRRMPETGTFGFSTTLFVENRWSAISKPVPGVEGRLSFYLFGFKMGMIDWDRTYWEVGLSY